METAGQPSRACVALFVQRTIGYGVVVWPVFPVPSLHFLSAEEQRGPQQDQDLSAPIINTIPRHHAVSLTLSHPATQVPRPSDRVQIFARANSGSLGKFANLFGTRD